MANLRGSLEQLRRAKRVAVVRRISKCACPCKLELRGCACGVSLLLIHNTSFGSCSSLRSLPSYVVFPSARVLISSSLRSSPLSHLTFAHPRIPHYEHVRVAPRGSGVPRPSVRPRRPPQQHEHEARLRELVAVYLRSERLHEKIERKGVPRVVLVGGARVGAGDLTDIAQALRGEAAEVASCSVLSGLRSGGGILGTVLHLDVVRPHEEVVQ